MTAHRDAWQRLIENSDLQAALATHFGYLAETPTLSQALASLFALATKVVIEGDALVVRFKNGSQLLCSAPREVEMTWPVSYRDAMRIHGRLIYPDPAGIVLGGDARYDLEGLACAMRDHSDHWVYHPDIRNSHGEPAPCLLDHGSGQPETPVDAKIGAVFIKRLAADLANHNVELPSAQNGASADALGIRVAAAFTERNFQYAAAEADNFKANETFSFPHKQFLLVKHGASKQVRCLREDDGLKESERLDKVEWRLKRTRAKSTFFADQTTLLREFRSLSDTVTVDLALKKGLEKGEPQIWIFEDGILYGSNKTDKECFGIDIRSSPQTFNFGSEQETGDRYGEISIGMARIGNRLFLQTTKHIHVFDVDAPTRPKFLKKKKVVATPEAEIVAFADHEVIAVLPQRTNGVTLVDSKTLSTRKLIEGYAKVIAWDTLGSELWLLLRGDQKSTTLFLACVDVVSAKSRFTEISFPIYFNESISLFVDEKKVRILRPGSYIEAAHFGVS